MREAFDRIRYCRCCKPSALSELPTFFEVVTLIGDCRWKVTSVSVGICTCCPWYAIHACPQTAAAGGSNGCAFAASQ